MNSDTAHIAEPTAPGSRPSSTSESPKSEDAGTISAGPPKAVPSLDEVPNEIYDHLIGELTRCASNSIGWWIRAGQTLLEAKEQLPPEDFPQILSSGRLPIKERSVRVLVRIASNKALCDPKLLFHLPRSISALNEIAGLDGVRIRAAISAGIIRPSTTAKEAKVFVSQVESRLAVVQNAE